MMLAYFYAAKALSASCIMASIPLRVVWSSVLFTVYAMAWIIQIITVKVTERNDRQFACSMRSLWYSRL